MDHARRRALLALLLLAPVPSIAVVFTFVIAPGTPGRIIWAIGKTVLYGFPVAWLVLVDRQRISWSPPRRGGFGTATVLGLVISGAIWIVYLLLPDGWLSTERLLEVGRANGIATPGAFVAIGAWVVVVNALMEEYVFRWFIFTRCRTLLPAFPAVLLSAAIFTIHHSILLAGYGVAAPFVLLASVGVFIGGVTWSWCYHRFDSVWPGYVSHAIVDVAILVVGWQLLFG